MLLSQLILSDADAACTELKAKIQSIFTKLYETLNVRKMELISQLSKLTYLGQAEDACRTKGPVRDRPGTAK